MDSIDLVMVQAYNNWYDSLTPGSLNYLMDVYLNWINVVSPFCSGCGVIPNFKGVPQSKLAMGILASPSAGGSLYYVNGTTFTQFTSWLMAQNYTVAGFMMWDSHWDQVNNYVTSTFVTQGLVTPVTPKPPSQPQLCNQTSQIT